MIAWQKRPLPQRGSLPIRPLNKGVNLAMPSNALQANEFLELTNYLVSLKGLVRLPGIGFLNSDSTNSYVASKPRNLATSYNSAGAERSILLCSGNFYLLNTKYEPLTEIFWQDTYTFLLAVTGTNITTTATITVNGTPLSISFDLTLLIRAGDKITVGTNTNVITAVSPQTLTCAVANIPNQGSTSTPFTITRQASLDIGLSNPEQMLDCFHYAGNIYITGRGYPLAKLDTTVSPPVIKSTVPISTASFGYPVFSTLSNNKLGTFSAVTGCFFKDYIWLGNTEERHDTIDTQTQRFQNRLRWSNPFAPVTDFIDTTRYIDLSFTPGAIVRVLPNGEQLIVYKQDAVLYGFRSNVPGLPLAFNSFDTGGIGLVGLRAVVDTALGHFFVGQNDIYFLSQQGVQAIGTPVLKETIDACYYPSEIQVVHDPKKRCVFFGFPKKSLNTEAIWVFQYETKAWSKIDYSTNFMAGRKNTTQMQWDLIPDATWDAITTASWDDFGAGNDGLFELIMAPNNYLTSIQKYQDIPTDAAASMATFITPDYDLDNPDIMKTFLRFAIKVDRYAVQDVTPTVSTNYTVYASNDFGSSYRLLGDIVIPLSKTEGHVNFRISGSAVRFKVVTTSVVASYTIIEITLDVNQAGPEQKNVN